MALAGAMERHSCSRCEFGDRFAEWVLPNPFETDLFHLIGARAAAAPTDDECHQLYSQRSSRR
jgi:hypothetical protein